MHFEMFICFRTFTEVVKLSTDISDGLKNIFYTDKVLDSIVRRKDFNSLKEVAEMITDFSLLMKFERFFNYDNIKSSIPWIDAVFKVMINIPLVDRSQIKPFKERFLVCACKASRIDIVKWFIDNGTSIHYKQDCLIRIAACHGSEELMKYLISQGADVHSYHDEPTRFSAKFGRLNILKLLVEAGSNIHAYNDEAFRHSCNNNKVEVVKYLIEKGADVHPFDNYDCRDNDYLSDEIITCVENHCRKYCGICRWKIVRNAAKDNNLDLIKEFDKECYDLNQRNYRLLADSIKHGSFEVVKYLMQRPTFCNSSLFSSNVEKAGSKCKNKKVKEFMDEKLVEIINQTMKSDNRKYKMK